MAVPISFDQFGVGELPTLTRPAQEGFSIFVTGLRHAESNNGDPKFLFNKSSGATGPLQMTPVAVADVGGDYNKALEDHSYAEQLGVKYAKKMWDSFEGDPRLAAAAYHTGIGTVKKLVNKANNEGVDPAEYVVTQLGPQGQRHNSKVMAQFPERKASVERFTDVMENTKPITFEEFDKHSTAVPKSADSPSIAFLKNLGGEAAAMADMAFGLVTMPVTLGAQLGATAVGLAAGEGSKAYEGGRKAGEKVGEAVGNPVQRLLNYFDSGKAYDASKTVAGMNWLMEQVNRADEYWNEKGLPKGALPMMVDTLMVGSVGAPSALKAERSLARIQKEVEQARASYADSGARRPTKQGIEDAEIISETRGLPAPAKPVTFDTFTRDPLGPGGDVTKLDDFVKELEQQNVAEAKVGRNRRVDQALVTGGAAAGGALGGYLYNKFRSEGNDLLDEEPGKSMEGNDLAKWGLGLGAMAGAIKLKGGAWHPEAVNRLAASLANKIVFSDWRFRDTRGNLDTVLKNLVKDPTKLDEGTVGLISDITEIKTYHDWAESRVQRYLNKYAGTATDPLKDLEIPFGDGTRRWGEITDAVIKGKQIEGPKGPETQYIVQERGDSSMRDGDAPGLALQAYISHMGDFARQNIPAAKLPQYDFVRLAKETAANDIRMAKEMEKASAASTKDLPVYKDYTKGDNPGTLPGMKWVELKLPEKLTEEQAKGVRRDFSRDRGFWVAQDSKGAVIQNNYTESAARGMTPEEAHLAGQLAQEGNQMGHCVGGYCEGVARGESRIFSLKDSKGRSHVTVEVEPSKKAGDRYIEQDAGEGFDAIVGSHGRAANITQIKGKQNRAPNAEYLPYVRDFVRSGKWGEVGDLGNTGLMKYEGSYHTPQELVPRAIYNLETALRPSKGYPLNRSERNQLEYNLDQLRTYQQDRQLAASAHPGGALSQALDITRSPIIQIRNILADHHPNVDVKLIELIEHPKDAIEIGQITSKVPDIGAGQAALQEIGKWADAHQRDVTSIVQPTPDSTMPLGKLVELYERAGFKRGPEQPYNDAVLMYRKPKGLHEEATSTQRSEAAQPSPAEARAEGNADEVGQAAGRQAGKIDRRLAEAMAVAGIGAVIGAAVSDADKRIFSALTGAGGALGLYALGRGSKGRTPIESLDYGLGVISTRIRNISEPLRFRAVGYERRVLRDTHQAFDAVYPMLKALDELPNAGGLNRAIIANDSVAVHKALATIGPKFTQTWQQTQTVLSNLKSRLTAIGRDTEILSGAFPRIVKDREGLLNASATLKPFLEAELKKAELAVVKAGGSRLSQIEESNVINRSLDAWRQANPTVAGRVTDAVIPFYANPSETLHSYISTVTRDLEKVRFFDQHAVGKKYLDLDTSVENLVRHELNTGRINETQANELRSIIKSRFTTGDQGGAPWVQDIRNLGNMGLLGNIVATATQFGDSAIPVYTHGLRSALASVVRNLTGRAEVRAQDFGLIDHIAEEFVGQRTSAKALNTIFKGVGFAAIDRFGKNVLLGAAFDRFARESHTPKGRAYLAEKYRESLGTEFPTLIRDLQNRRRTDVVDSVLFAELSDVQPITRMEVPQGHLDNPNGRILYMLKNFMIKQMDIIRRDGYNEIKKGNVAKGVGNLAKYGLILGIAGATIDQVKNWIMGKNDPLETKDVWMNILKTFGLSQYVMDTAAKDGPVQAILQAAIPPYKMMDDIIKLKPKAVEYIPVIGKLFYGRVMEGGQKATDSKVIGDMMRLIDSETDAELKNKKIGRDKLYRMYQRGDYEGFEGAVEKHVEKYNLTDKQQKALRENAKLPPEIRKFKTLSVDQQRNILEKMSPAAQENFRPHAKKELRNAQ